MGDKIISYQCWLETGNMHTVLLGKWLNILSYAIFLVTRVWLVNEYIISIFSNSHRFDWSLFLVIDFDWSVFDVIAIFSWRVQTCYFKMLWTCLVSSLFLADGFIRVTIFLKLLCNRYVMDHVLTTFDWSLYLVLDFNGSMITLYLFLVTYVIGFLGRYF